MCSTITLWSWFGVEGNSGSWPHTAPTICFSNALDRRIGRKPEDPISPHRSMWTMAMSKINSYFMVFIMQVKTISTTLHGSPTICSLIHTSKTYSPQLWGWKITIYKEEGERRNEDFAGRLNCGIKVLESLQTPENNNNNRDVHILSVCHEQGQSEMVLYFSTKDIQGQAVGRYCRLLHFTVEEIKAGKI